VLGELLALPVELHERLVRGHRPERVRQLALDELPDRVLVEVPLAERPGRREDILGDGLHLDVELRRHVRLDLVLRDERVPADLSTESFTERSDTRMSWWRMGIT
jgi:hypothetical protein